MMVMYVSDEEFDEQEIKEMDEQNKARQGAGIEYRLSIAQFNGAYTYDEMKIFLDSFLKSMNKKEMGPGDENEQSVGEERDLLQVKSMKHLNKYCVKDSCYMLLVDNSP